MKTRFDAVLPPNLRKHLRPETIKNITAFDEHLLLIDARIAEILEAIRDANPTGYVDNAQVSLNLLRLCLEADDREGAEASLKRLELLLETQRMAAMGYEQLDKALDRRSKLAHSQLEHITVLNKTVLVGDISSFLQAVTQEVLLLTDDKQKITAYVTRVRALASGLVAAPVTEDITDAEVVEEGGEE